MRKLRISEQLLIVLFIAVLLPSFVVALIITNVNQQAVRKELIYSANITTDNIYQRLTNNLEEKKQIISYITKSIVYIDSSRKINDFLSKIKISSDDIAKLDIINNNRNFSNSKFLYDKNKKSLIIYEKLNKKQYIREIISLKAFENKIFQGIHNDQRQIYILDSDKNIVMAHNPDQANFREILPLIPDKYKPGECIRFGEIKNQPNIFLRLKEPNWSIVVITPQNLTDYGIIKARYKIIIALLIAAFTTIVAGIGYSYSLNTSIKQLVKAIFAMKKGNYKRKIRLLKNFFTPYEVVFLANEVNKMAVKVDKAYKELQEANNQLSKIDEIKSNLIDTVSHEFRTPLTCIKGYTSRLLRSDINVNDEVKTKSLKIIKQQTERLSRLVDDLLVIPEIESSLLNIFPDEINIKDILENCIFSVQQKQARKINLFSEENMPVVYADPDRVEQVAINLLDNAIKYSPENSEINVSIYKENDLVFTKIKNECEPMGKVNLEALFDKFTRLDDNLTRTTRGTGLGLYITKGLIESMNGKITLSAENGFKVIFALPTEKGV